MAHPINPQTGRVMADGCEWGPEDFARTDPATDKIIEEILTERRRQDAQWGGQEHDDEHKPMDWKTVLLKHTNALAHKVYDVPGGGDYKMVISDDYRERLVKIAALAVAAVESYDRKAGK